MTVTTILNASLSSRIPALWSPLMQRLAAWRGAPQNGSSLFATDDSAASLYARAARYEATQPGFAADLRAAAEAMDRAAEQRPR